MINYHEAHDLIKTSVTQIMPSIELPIADSLGFIAAEQVVCNCYIAPFDNSAMDGFAFKHADLQTGKTEYAVVGSSFAGDHIAKGDHGAWEIMTGAGVPEGFDTVIKIEDIKILTADPTGRPTRIKITVAPKSVKFENNVRKAGQDFKPNDVIIAAHETINAAHISALASVGIAKINVLKPPQIAVMSTGKEIIDDANATLKSGQIRNSNGPNLMATLSQMNVKALYGGTIHDEVADYEQCLSGLLNKADIIISTGAVSMGRHDFIPTSIVALGGKIIFHKCRIRPGKPILFAKFPANESRAKDVFYFGLPGNPVSASVGFRFFVTCLINQLTAQHSEAAQMARLKGDIKKPHDFKMFYKAFASLDNGQLCVNILQGQESFKTKPMLKANCWVALAEHQHQAIAGDLVKTYPMSYGYWQF